MTEQAGAQEQVDKTVEGGQEVKSGDDGLLNRATEEKIGLAEAVEQTTASQMAARQQADVRTILSSNEETPKQRASVGRIVLYTLSQDDVLGIIGQRDAAGVEGRYNRPTFGEDYPLVVVRVWDNEYGDGIPGVNGQVFLDGGDTFWVTSRAEGSGEGTWHWPVRN